MPAPESKRPCIHIGYHKTATTWLQRSVFIPAHGFEPVLSHPEIFADLIAPHALDFSAAPLRDEIAARIARTPHRAVVSLENLSGNPFEGGKDSVDIAHRLAAVAPEARILVTIREQTRILASLYMQYVSRGGTMPPAEFFAEDPAPGYACFRVDHVYFHRLVGLYQDLFGAGNVFVLPQETMQKDQARAIALLAAFTGNTAITEKPWVQTAGQGVSYPESVVPVQRRINYFRKAPNNPHPILDLGTAGLKLYRAAGKVSRHLAPQGRRPVTGFVRARFGGQFADSNRQLAQMLTHPIDLQGYEGIAD